MFALCQPDSVVEHDPSAVPVTGARSGADVCRELGPAAVAAGVVELQRMLARAAAHRRVSPGWPAAGSPWIGYVPGPELAALATQRLQDAALTQEQRLDCIEAIDRSISALQGIKTAAVASFVDAESRQHPDGVPAGLKSAQAELEFLLKLSPTASRNLVGRAQQLQSLPTTMATLKAGAISQACADTVADETALLGPEHRRAVEERLFPDARTHTEPRLKREVRKDILEIDPETGEEAAPRGEATPGRDGVERRVRHVAAHRLPAGQ